MFTPREYYAFPYQYYISIKMQISSVLIGVKTVNIELVWRLSEFAFFCADFGWRIFYFLEVAIMEEELYKKMYYHLFNAVTDAINTKDPFEQIVILKQAQIDTEEMYISYEE